MTGPTIHSWIIGVVWGGGGGGLGFGTGVVECSYPKKFGSIALVLPRTESSSGLGTYCARRGTGHGTQKSELGILWVYGICIVVG